MRYLSVCSGIEAASVAWHPLGWEPVGFCEIEPFPAQVLAHHWPTVPNYGDFTRLIDAAHPVHSSGVDLLVGGTPCQAFSIAGLRRGLADARGGLTLEFLRLAHALQPRWIVWENVPGVLSQDGGRAFGAFLGALGELGYGWAYRVLDAQYVRVDGYPHAVPQRRRRVFVVGCAGGDFARAAAVLLEPEGVRRDPPTRREAREGTAADPRRSAANGGGERGGERDGRGGGVVVALPLTATKDPSRSPQSAEVTAQVEAVLREQSVYGGNRTSGALDVAPALLASATASGRQDFGSEAFVAVGALGALPQPVVFDTTQITHPENRCNPQPGDPCHPLAAGAHPPALAFDARQSDAIVYGDKSGPLDTDGHTIGVALSVALRGRDGGATAELGGEFAGTLRASTGGGDKPHVLSHMAVRRLTPTECERLQGFPDGHTAIPWKGKPAEECPDGPRYKALGNSMACNVMRWIGMRIAEVER